MHVDANPTLDLSGDQSDDQLDQPSDSDINEDLEDMDPDIGPDMEPPAPGWQDLTPITRGARQETAVFTHQGEIWVLGGFDDRATMLRTVEIYNPQFGTWRAGPELPVGMHHANAQVVEDGVWIIGFLVGGFNADGRIFELVEETWEPRGEMPEDRARGASVLGIDGSNVYIAGGLDGGAVSRFDRYDTATGQWTTLADLPEIMDHGAGAFMDGEMIIAGGRSGSIGGHTGAVHRFDPDSDTWSLGALMPTSRGGVAHTVHDGRLFVMGGEGNPALPSGVFDDVESYDPTTNTWQVYGPMPNPRHGMGAASFGGVIYVPGGAAVQAFGATDFVDAYVP